MKEMKEQYQIEKWFWNQDDFDQMGWHDNPIWAMSFDDNVKFDLDYIFKWVHPPKSVGAYKFWISPATLVFKNPTKFKVEIETELVYGLEIADIEREIVDGKTQYIIEAQEGRIIIETEEFYQVIRRPPTLQISQYLSELERGPISFSEHSEKNYQPTKREIEGRDLSYKFHELCSQKTSLEIEYDEYNFEALNPKDRILKRREFKSQIKRLKNMIEETEVQMNKIYES